jgi:hypothetical protein
MNYSYCRSKKNYRVYYYKCWGFLRQLLAKVYPDKTNVEEKLNHDWKCATASADRGIQARSQMGDIRKPAKQIRHGGNKDHPFGAVCKDLSLTLRNSLQIFRVFRQDSKLQ